MSHDANTAWQTQVDKAEAAEAVSVEAETPRKDKGESEVAKDESQVDKEETELEAKSTQEPGQEESTLPISALATKMVVGLYFRFDMALLRTASSQYRILQNTERCI